jgi:hypothetical protein
MSELIGKWVQVEGQPYEGLWFEFREDGTFTAQYEPMGINSSGTYETDGKEITVQQTSHTLGMVGEFKGLFSIDDDQLMMSLASAPGGPRPKDLTEARIYQKEKN